MADLHERLRVAITARRDIAEAAVADRNGPGDRMDAEWVHDKTRWHVQTQGGLGVVSGSVFVYLRHVAANGPAQILLDTDAHLGVADRHRPCTDTHDDVIPTHWSDDQYLRHAPSPVCHQHSRPTPWPCPDWLDVASSYPEVSGGG